MATLGGKDVAGIGPKQAAGMPSAWSIYIGTADAEALGAVVAESGGTVIAPAFDVGPQGRMAVFRDPAGAFISAWEPRAMSGFDAEGPGTMGWAELSSRKLDASVAFYAAVFGWGTHASQMPDGSTYVEFQLNGESIDLRVAVLPTTYGEKVVVRILQRSSTHVSLGELGMSELLGPIKFAVDQDRGGFFPESKEYSDKPAELIIREKILAALNQPYQLGSYEYHSTSPLSFPTVFVSSSRMRGSAFKTKTDSRLRGNDIV